MIAALVNLNPADTYLHWGFILVSLANFLVVVAMVVLFVLAITLPFVHARRRDNSSSGATGGKTALPESATTPTGEALPGASSLAGSPMQVGSATQAGSATLPTDRAAYDGASPSDGGDPSLWTSRLRRLWMARLPPDKLLPDSQPAYVASWIYVFGVLTLAGFLIACASGLVLALEGPIWWHTSTAGHFVNSLHLWSVECFMGFMAIHLWGKFWMASWRGKRALTWMTGVIAFLVSVFEGFTGYLSQTNFDSQWIAFEAKDAMNAAGIGAFFNTMNFGQALMLHIVFVPLVLVAIIALHIVMVRLRGVVHPIDANPEHLGCSGATGGPSDQVLLTSDQGAEPSWTIPGHELPDRSPVPVLADPDGRRSAGTSPAVASTSTMAPSSTVVLPPTPTAPETVASTSTVARISPVALTSTAIAPKTVSPTPLATEHAAASAAAPMEVPS